MQQPAKRLKANKVIEGQICGWSSQTIRFGDDVAVCTACDTPHLGVHWDRNQGCSLTSCQNAPLRQFGGAAEPANAPLSPAAPQQYQQPTPPPAPLVPPAPLSAASSYERREPAQPLGGGHHEQMAARRAQARSREYAQMRPGMTKCPHCGNPIAEGSDICRYCKNAPTPDGVYTGPRMQAPGAKAALIFGILGLLCCPVVFSVLAIVKANEAKAAIADDPRYSGKGMATAGQVLGILGLVFFAINVLVAVAGGGFGGGADFESDFE